MKAFTVYKIKNKLNNKIYIGQTCDSIKARISKHLRVKSVVGMAIQKYGIDNFEIKSIFNNLTINEANLKEIFCIRIFKSIAPYGYNIQLGGDNKAMHQLTKDKLSTISKNSQNIERLRIMGNEFRANNPHPLLGKKLSEEQRLKLSASHMGQVPWNKGKGKSKINIKTSKLHTLETRQKISESMAKIVSTRDPTSYAKMAVTKKNKPIKSLYKKVKCLELNKIFESIGHAAMELDIQRTGISMVLNGTIKTTGGFSFIRVT